MRRSERIGSAAADAAERLPWSQWPWSFMSIVALTALSGGIIGRLSGLAMVAAHRALARPQRRHGAERVGCANTLGPR